jgi:hypothetical protein
MQNYRTETVRGPFGDRDCWPATGPIYGFLDEDESPRRSKQGFWQRWLGKDADNEDQFSRGPISPIHY